MFLGTVLPRLDERQRRVLVGAAVVVWGSGGKTVVAVASGMSRYTVMKAEREVVEGMEVTDCLRVPGGGDRALIVKQEGLLAVLDELVHPHRRGSPVSLLWWSSRSGARLADDLVGEGFKVSERTVLRLLGLLGFRCWRTRRFWRVHGMRIGMVSSGV